ncbi:MAG: YbaB/EbfC family nucleoid-associated protein [Planctomycetota bacterium]|jgi:DNA-binding YbaB/EbfC family protein|nr:YbaB/EbfC family nucleoid-associated protein [Planctomycetota bacterium]
MEGKGGFFDLLKSARLMMDRAKTMRSMLVKRTVQGSSGAGLVTASMNGTGELLGLKFDRLAITPDDPEMLADLIVAAVADARRKIETLKAETLREVASGIDPALVGLDLDALL